MKKLEGNVLVLGHGERAFLSVIRSLGRAGLSVHVAMCEPSDLALKSRYVTKRHEVPVYRPGEKGWLDAMDGILAETPFQLVIPCEDQALIPLQVHQHRLANRCELYTLDDQSFETAFSKIKSFQLAEKLGIPQPRTVILGEGDEGDRVAEFSLPVVVKPPSSFTPEDLTAKRGVARCRTRQQLADQLKKLADWKGALVQENFIGSGIGVELLADKGEVLVAFQHVRVHEPLEGGGSSYRRSSKLHPELLEASKSIIGALGYSGVAMVEFKFNFETGRWVFVEINGRFWGSLPLAIAAGVDFPRYLYEMRVHGRRDFPQSYRVPVFCRNISSDHRWLRSNLTADKHDPLLATRPLRSVVAEAFNVLTLRERWDTLVWDDPAPGVADFTGILGDAGRMVRRAVTRKIAASYPVRARLRSRLLTRARNANNILFICKGNICRSPYAEHYARRRLPGNVTVNSCGYYPVSGRPSPKIAQEVAEQFGVDLSGHQSQILSEDLLREADLIFTFDEQNHATVLTRFPAVGGRLFGLGVLCSEHPYEVADPYGSQASGFHAAYTQISDAIDNLSASLNAGSNTIAPSSPELRRDTV